MWSRHLRPLPAPPRTGDWEAKPRRDFDHPPAEYPVSAATGPLPTPEKEQLKPRFNHIFSPCSVSRLSCSFYSLFLNRGLKVPEL